MVDRRAIPDVAMLPERHEESGAELDWSFHWEMGKPGTDRYVNASVMFRLRHAAHE